MATSTDDGKARSVAGFEEGLFDIDRLDDGRYRYKCKRCGWTYEARWHAEVAPHPCTPNLVGRAAR